MDDDYIDKAIGRKMAQTQSEWWWIYGSEVDHNGKMRPFLLGAYEDYETADRIAQSKRLTSFDIVSLGTRSMAHAGQIIRARRVQGNTPMSEVFRRAAHKNVGSEV